MAEAPAPCPICGEHAGWPIPFRRRLEQGGLTFSESDLPGYGWRLCARCGNGYPTVTAERARLAQAWTLAHTVPPDPQQAATQLAFQQRFSRINGERAFRLFSPLVRVRGTSRMLDVACGFGETANSFAQQGWRVEATDADPAMLPYHLKLGLPARIGQFETMEFDGTYDLIHIGHAIYFMSEPMKVLRRAAALLNPHGVLAVVLADFMAAFDPGLPTYVHTFYPVASSMPYALALAGLETVTNRRISGSVYLAGRPSANSLPVPTVDTNRIYRAYRTKRIRYALFGGPYRLARKTARTLFGRTRPVSGKSA